MAHSIKSVSTTDVPEPLRTDFWNNVLGSVFGDLRFHPIGHDPFNARIECLSLLGVHLCRLQGSPVRVEARPSNAKPRDEAFRILFQTQGSAVFEQDTCKIQFGPGDCLIYDFSRPHRLTNLGETKAQSVTVPKRLLVGRGLPLEHMPVRCEGANPIVSLTHDFLDRTMNMGAPISDEIASGIADATLDLLMTSLRASSNADDALSHTDHLRRRAYRYILDHLHDPGLNVSTIACAMGFSERYLHMIFREERTSITRLIWRLRLERCREELVHADNSGRSLTELAFAWGFSSSAHFSRLFRERFGTSPSQLRTQSGEAVQ